jgi:predicted P-loop ATPase
MDFQGLAELLIGRSDRLVSSWLPGGRIQGNEFVCASLQGGHGDSLKVNLTTGKWADFAKGDKGRDLISLYASIYNIKNGEAAKVLAEENNFNLSNNSPAAVIEPVVEITEPPANAGLPVMTHPTYGAPVASWCYKGETGKPQFYIARYNPVGGKKQIIPWSWAPSKARYIQKGFNSPRPLYGLELLAERPDAPILLVEGEKACEAARHFASNVYVVMTWSHGVQSLAKTDWTPIKDKKVLLWPDADAPGLAAMLNITRRYLPDADVKILDIQDKPKGWDAADSDFTWETFFEWAKPIAKRQSEIVESQDTALSIEQAIEMTEVIKPAKTRAEVIAEDEPVEIPASLQAAWEQIGIAQTKNGNAICNADNALRVLQRWPAFKDLLWFDEFHGKFFTKNLDGSVREWRDLDEIELFFFMQRELGLRNITQPMVQTACISYAHKSPRNEPRDWMNALEWDGVERIDAMFCHYFGVKHSEHAIAASRNWWISLVARVLSPGSKVDSMVILEGAQGKFKSMALGVIGGKWYSEAHESVTSKDFFMMLQGKFLIEISELDAFSKAETNTIKKVISCQMDRFRPPYGRISIDHPRQCVFVGTTNEKHYLKDATGARRFWPVKIKNINIPDLKRDRDQLFAEAVSKFKSGVTWWEMPEETKAEQEDRRQHDEWEGLISECISTRDEVTIATLATACLDMPMARLDAMAQRRIGRILHQFGWVARTVRRDGSTQRVWTEDKE